MMVTEVPRPTSVLRIGPKTTTGSIVVSSRFPPSFSTKSQAARSARVLLLLYAFTATGPSRIVQSFSVNGALCGGCPPSAAARDEVSMTRLTPAV